MIENNQAELAPDFTATDSEGRTIHFADYKGKKNIVLVLTAGFSDRIAEGIWRSYAKITRSS